MIVIHAIPELAPDYAERRKPFREEHLSRLLQLRTRGQVVAVGPRAKEPRADMFYRGTSREEVEGLVTGDVYYREKPLQIKKEGRGYAMYIRLPFAEKDKIQVWTQGDELVVQVDNQRRNVVLPRTLACRELLGAAFQGQHLRVAFGAKEDHA